MTESDRLAQLKEWRLSVDRLHRSFMTNIAENFRYAVGIQWKSEDVDFLDAANKPHLTYNEILPKLNVLVGEYFENVFEPSVQPKRRASATAALVLNKLLKQVMDLCDGNYEEAAMFLDGISCGIGNCAIDIDDSKDPFNGDIIIRRVSPFSVEWDWTSSDFNPDVSSRFVTEKWFWTKDQMALEYPKKERDITDAALESETGEISDMMQEAGTGGDYEDYPTIGDISTMDKSGIRLAAKQYLVRQVWWKRFDRKPHLLDKIGEKKVIISNGKLNIAKQYASLDPQRYIIKDILTTILVKTVYSGQLILDEVENPFGVNCTKYPLRRFFPYYFDGYWLSPVDSMKDPQDEMNKRISQTLHAINSIVRFFVLNKKSGGAKEEDIEKLLSQETQVLEYNTEKPEVVVPNLMSAISSLSSLASTNQEVMSRVSGINEIPQGRAEYSGQSGRSMQTLAEAFKSSSRHVFANMSRARQEIYGVIVDLISNTDVFSEQEIIQIIDDDDIITRQVLSEITPQMPQRPMQPQPPNMNEVQAAEQMYPGASMLYDTDFKNRMAEFQSQSQRYDQQVEIMARQHVISQIRSLSLGRYGVKISQKPISQTINMMMFYMMLEMRKMGIVIPDDILFKSSELPESIKDELIDRYRQAAQQQAMTPQLQSGVKNG